MRLLAFVIYQGVMFAGVWQCIKWALKGLRAMGWL